MNGNLPDYQKIFDCLSVMLFIITHDGTILAVNKSVLKRLCYQRDELVGRNILYVHPEGSEDEVVRVLSEIEDSEEVLCNLPLITKVGKQIETETRIYKGTWEGKGVLFGFCSDVTEQKNVERKCSAIFKHSPVPIMVSKVSDGTVIDVNDSWCDLIQYDRDHILNKTTKELNVWKNYEDRHVAVEKMEADGYINLYPVILLTSYGDDVYGLISGVRLTGEDEDLWITSFVDHTEQKLLEQQLDEIREIAVSSALEQLDKQMASNKYIKVSKNG